MSQTILERIVAHKRVEVESQKKVVSEARLLQLERKRPHYSLVKNLNLPGTGGIIAEFKRKSPSKDWINRQAIATEVTSGYEQAGASGVSILTDHEFFGGTSEDLISAGKQLQLPVLRKDFMIDAYQVVEAAQLGADVILLIAAILSVKEVEQLAALAHQLNLEVLLEIHNREEMNRLCDAVDMVGVNNRNLHTFETQLRTSEELSQLIPDRFTKISESGIHSANDILYLKTFGFKGFLIGESFMKTTDPGKACASFINQLKGN